MADFRPAEKLRQHRPLLVAMEAVGWLHMLGKARAEFLRGHGGQQTDYDYRHWHERENPPFPWHDLLEWVLGQFGTVDGSSLRWPSTLADFLTKHTGNDAGILGLLQASHGIVSGIEKNAPAATSRYLGQGMTHMWLASAFGHPLRNLLADPPEALTELGWQHLLSEVWRMLEELRALGTTNTAEVGAWQQWRESASRPGSILRSALSSTVAETRLPNNDVTLWDQSYVAAALFKSAVAGAMLEGDAFPWPSSRLKSETRWRLLTIGVGTDHYEARAVRVADWIGAAAEIEGFFDGVRQLVEVNLAVGSLLYRDSSVCVFSFPGERTDSTGTGLQREHWQRWLESKCESLAKDRGLETPPWCSLGKPTRSLVTMVKEMRSARDVLAVPVHKTWGIPDGDQGGHVCPVCLVRHNGSASDKQQPCDVCRQRRRGRLDAWLGGEFGGNTIWLNEVADANDRVALITLSLDLESWLDGTRLDSLRTQSIAEWRWHNPELVEYWQRDASRRRRMPNPIRPDRCYQSLVEETSSRLTKPGPPDQNDLLFANLQDGYRRESSRQEFFEKIVEDRSNAPQWDKLSEEQKARWLVHQLVRKLPSPGRVYRFWRQAEEFFGGLLGDFRAIAARHPNRLRVRRVVLLPDQAQSSSGWQDRDVYDGRLGDAPISLLYRQDQQAFVTVCNLARLLRPENAETALVGREIRVQSDDDRAQRTLRVRQVKDSDPKGIGKLGIYHPVILLERSPLRFRVLAPLDVASACLDRAFEAWNAQFGRVWDRLPLRAGVVAFPQKLPFQAVIEATRNLEESLTPACSDVWRVTGYESRAGVVALAAKRPDGGTELRTIPFDLPDGRADVFYPYLAVEDGTPRFPLDFQHPDGQVYRHALDLRRGDGIRVHPARVATLFLDSTGRRFDRIEPRPLTGWGRMREVWRLVKRVAPSVAALHGAWADLLARKDSWQGPDGDWLPGGRAAWRDLARAIFADRLGATGAALDALVEAADYGTLDWSLDWHLSVLKEQIGEVTRG